MLFRSKRLGIAWVAFALLVSGLSGCGNNSTTGGCLGPIPPCSGPSPQPTMWISEFGGLTANSKPADLALGPDGNMWFTESNGGRIGRITPSGGVAEYIEPIANQPNGITAGIDGNLWVAGVNAVERVTTGGTFTQFAYPTASAGGGEIVSGTDGRLWFAETLTGEIGAVTTNGVISEYTVGTTGSLPVGMTLDPNRNGVWYTLYGANAIGLIGPTGTVLNLYTIPTANSQPISIVAGPDGALWFAEYGAAKIGRVTTSGQFTEFPLAAGAQPNAITAGPDGNLWFVEFGPNKIGRITTAGTVTEFSIPTAGSGPVAIRQGVGRNLWFVEYNAARIGLVSNF